VVSVAFASEYRITVSESKLYLMYLLSGGQYEIDNG
jgi:hypothetical protein